MPLPFRKYIFKELQCSTFKEFHKLVKTLLHTAAGDYETAFITQNTTPLQIHKTNTQNKAVEKLIAPFWENNRFGIMAYGTQGIKLAETWLGIVQHHWQKIAEKGNLENLAPNGVHRIEKQDYVYTVNFETVVEEKKLYHYQSEFWIPANKVFFNSKMKCHLEKTIDKGEVLLDFIYKIKHSLIKHSEKTGSTLLKQNVLHPKSFIGVNFIAYKMLYKKEDGVKEKTTFKIKIITNFKLPAHFHLGQAIGYGYGWFTQLDEKQKTISTSN